MSNKTPFQPGNLRGHIYLLAAGYLVYLIYEIVRDCLGRGGADALEIGGVILLTAGAALLGFFSWRQYHTPPVFDEAPEENPALEEAEPLDALSEETSSEDEEAE